MFTFVKAPFGVSLMLRHRLLPVCYFPDDHRLTQEKLCRPCVLLLFLILLLLLLLLILIGDVVVVVVAVAVAVVIVVVDIS